jgi:hypothetical protein
MDLVQHAPLAAPWSLSTWTDAALLAASINPEAVPDGAAGVSPAQWFATLRSQGKILEATTFLAHALPRYECVIWATRSLIEGQVLDRSDPFVTAALRWIDDPSDRLRRAAGELADISGRARAGELLCQAVFYSGGSIAPDDLAAVNAPAQTCALMAAAAVLSGAYDQKMPAAVLERAFDIGDALARQQR